MRILFFIHIAIVNPVNAKNSSLFSASVSGEAWYSFWQSTSGLDSVGATIDYEIEPTTVTGYSATLGVKKNDQIFSSFLLDYMTSKINKKNEQNDSGINVSDDFGVFEVIKGNLNQYIGIGYIHVDIMEASYEGYATLKKGGAFFGIENGSNWIMNSEWYKSDYLLLLNIGSPTSPVLTGIGYRHLKFNKPLAIIDFYGSTQKGQGFGELDAVSVDTIIEGTITETKVENDCLIIGMWDGGIIGMHVSKGFFYDGSFYIGGAKYSNKSFKISDRICAGCEGSIGYSFPYTFFNKISTNTRIGFRGMMHKSDFAVKTGEDEHGVIYKGAMLYEKWYGPFLNFTCSF